MVSSEYWFGAEAGFYNAVATQSLRFDIASTSYLKRQPSASNRKTYVLSFWLKPSKDTLNSSFLAGRTGSGGTYTNLCFSASDNRIRVVDNQTSYPALETNAKYRDLSAWYHIVFAIDTTQTTNSNKLKVYVNGTEQTYATSYYYTTNADTNINSTDDHYIGYQAGVANLDGYLAEYNFIDGLSFFSDTSGTANSSFNINSFGQRKNNVWIAKAYSGSYGTNGFRLAFNSTDFNTSSSSTMTDPHGSGTAVPANGLADASGQGNHWTTNGIGAEDFVADSPENNFPTINPLHQSSDYSSVTISEGALSLKHSNLAHASAIATMALPKSGKWYWETLINSSATSGTNAVGVVDSTYNNSNALSGSGNPFWSNGFGIYGNTGGNFGTAPSVTWVTSGSATTFTANDVIGVAYDADNKDVEWYKNGVKMDYNVTNFDDDGNDLIPASSAYGNPANSGIVFNFGQDSSFAGAKTSGSAEAQDGNGIGDFYDTPPSGYLALCSSNLEEPTISPNANTQAENHFGILTYTSDGNAVNIVSGGNDNNSTAIGGEIDFSPDWVWIKRINASNNHQLFDTSRGQNVLQSNETDDESNYSSYFEFLSSSNGFRLPATSANMNASGGTYVAWNWKAGGATPTKTYKVIVVADSTDYGHGTGSNKYQFLQSDDTTGFGTNGVDLNLQEGGTYTFDWSHSSAQGHPIRFSLTNDGTHSSGTSAGSEYTTGVVKDDSAYKTTITVASGVANLYYYCQNHSGMGAEINTNTTHGSTNFDGSILSVVQTNQTAGLSIITWTGNGSTQATIGHGLGTTPAVVITKSRSVNGSDWRVWHRELASAGTYLTLHRDLATGSSTSVWGTSPAQNDKTFSIGNNTDVNGSTSTYLSYCFTDVEGYSKFGTYTGNGDTSGKGTFVHLGFRPAFLIYKSEGSGNWLIDDDVTQAFNPDSNYLVVDTADLQGDTTTNTAGHVFDMLSNGFKMRNYNSARNADGQEYVYLAFARTPFKYANAR